MAAQRRRKSDTHSVVARVIALTGLPSWKVRLLLGEALETAEEAWSAFSCQRENINAFMRFLELAMAWDLFPHLGEIPKEEPFLSAMFDSWRERKSAPK